MICSALQRLKEVEGKGAGFSGKGHWLYLIDDPRDDAPDAGRPRSACAFETEYDSLKVDLENAEQNYSFPNTLHSCSS